MNRRKLDAAIAEAERFLTVARGLAREADDYRVGRTAAERKAKAEGRDWPDYRDWPEGHRQSDPFVGSPESGATRRASMDLSRALADLRRPS